jgi:phosphoribosyl-ATP pyrophosphohydrolase/phosphoribosyl-AMP cyclohydrolase
MIDFDLDRVDFGKGSGLVPVICQEAVSGAVLMLAYANRQALERTLESGEMHYWSRSRGLWHKGATSGNMQRVVELRQDCDGDAILARVEPVGPACHTGSQSCFGNSGEVAGTLGRLDAVIRERGSRTSAGDSIERDIETLRAGTPADGDTTERNRERHRPTAHTTKSAHSDSPAVGDKADQQNDHHQITEAQIEKPSSYTQRLLADRNLRLKKVGEEAAEFVTACADGDRERATEEAADLIYHMLVALSATGAGLRDVEQALARRDRPRRDPSPT